MLLWLNIRENLTELACGFICVSDCLFEVRRELSRKSRDYMFWEYSECEAHILSRLCSHILVFISRF